MRWFEVLVLMSIGELENTELGYLVAYLASNQAMRMGLLSLIMLTWICMSLCCFVFTNEMISSAHASISPQPATSDGLEELKGSSWKPIFSLAPAEGRVDDQGRGYYLDESAWKEEEEEDYGIYNPSPSLFPGSHGAPIPHA